MLIKKKKKKKRRQIMLYLNGGNYEKQRAIIATKNFPIFVPC